MRTRKTQSTLYDFIRLMSRDEKRYYTQSTTIKSIKRNKNSSKLFYIVNKNSAHANNELDQLISNKFPFTKNISKLKNKLYHQLLETTTSYSIEKNQLRKFRVQLNKIDLLYERGLNKAALKLVEETLKLAVKYETNEVLSELYQYKVRLSQHQDKGSQKLQVVLEKGRKATTNVAIELESFMLNSEGFSIYKAIGLTLKSSKNDEKFNALFHKIKTLRKKNMSFKTKFYVNQVYAQYYNYKGNFKQEFTYTQANYQLFEEQPAMKKYAIKDYCTAINNFAISNTRAKKNNETIRLFKLLQDLDEMPSVSDYDKLLIFQYKAANQLDFYLLTGQVLGLSTYIDWIKDGLKKYNYRLSDLFNIVILCNLTEYHFWVQEYGKAKSIINNILSHSYTETRQDLVRFIYSLNLIVCYEMNDFTYLQHLIKSHKTLKLLSRKTPVELWLLNFMEDALKKDIHNHHYFLKKEKELLTLFLKNPYHGNNEDSFNMSIWLRLKTEKISLEKAMTEYNDKGSDYYERKRITEISKILSSE